MSGFAKIRMDGGVEQVAPDTVNIPAEGTSGEIIISPKHMKYSISALRFLITVSVVNGSTALSGGTVGNFIKTIKILQGTKTLLELNGMQDVQILYHIKTGQTLSDVALPTTANTTDTASLEFYLPYEIAKTNEQVVVKAIFNNYSTSVSGGSVSSATGSVGLAFYYQKEKVVESEQWNIIETATTIEANTDKNLGADLPSKPVYELWVNVGSDSNLNYYKYILNSEELFNAYVFDLIEYEIREPQYSHISGLMKLPINSGVLINTSSNLQPEAIINLSTAEQVRIYAKVG